jgi:hypothetical protein
MSIVPLLLFCSLCLVAGSIVLFVWSSAQGDCHQADRLCLLPLDADDAEAGDTKKDLSAPPAAAPTPEPSSTAEGKTS